MTKKSAQIFGPRTSTRKNLSVVQNLKIPNFSKPFQLNNVFLKRKSLNL